MKKLLIALITVFFFCEIYSQEIPQKISYQGKLLENGNPVTGTKSISFTIDTWTETQNVTVTNGLYSVQLGSITPIPVNIFTDNATVSLQISVEGTNLTPQTEILSVAYAFKAEKAVDTDNIAGNPVSGIPSTNQVLKWDGTQWVPGTDSLTLPYSVTYSGSSDILTINFDNPGVNAKILGLTSNTANRIIGIENDGTGNSIDIDNNNANSGDAINIYNNGVGESIDIDDNGTADAIRVDNDGGGNGIEIYQRESANDAALFIRHYDAGNDCAEFFLNNSSNSGNAIYATTSGTGKAGYFDGDVEVVGTLSKGGGSFKIDHPLDPKNKYLYHSFVESPDMMNVYNGNVILDNIGEATVELPAYFEALNMEFRYQLTCIGGYAPVYISKEIYDNKFVISGGTLGLKVSWQVTGIRQDPYANQNRIHVEVEKPDKEKGHYLHYKEYQQPIEKSIKLVNKPDLLKDDKKEE